MPELTDQHHALLEEVARVLRAGGYTTAPIFAVLAAANECGDVYPLRDTELWRIAYATKVREAEEFEDLMEAVEEAYEEG